MRITIHKHLLPINVKYLLCMQNFLGLPRTAERRLACELQFDKFIVDLFVIEVPAEKHFNLAAWLHFGRSALKVASTIYKQSF